MSQLIETREIKHFHLFCGAGGGAKGFNAGQARVGNMVARSRCIGGVDNDPSAIKDFEKLSGVKGTVLDLFSRQQYADYYGHEPPADWREATPDDIRQAAHNECPNIVFLSAPCRSFSGLLCELAYTEADEAETEPQEEVTTHV
jgi:site-specific DNA-cytosine methylase